VQKCPYCDFNSHTLSDAVVVADYVDRLLLDLRQEMAFTGGRSLRSIFIGGGTPSLLPPAQLRRLLNGIRQIAELTADCEVTIEANPGTADAAFFAGYRQAGVNRLSIGVQSFDSAALGRLGRIHGPEEAVQAFRMARRAGFANINLDLMFGLPDQDEAKALADVEQALALAPEHLSYYQLTLEPNTPFHHSPPGLPDEERIWDFQQAARERLAAAGYRHYEVSAYARPGFRCRHNLNYWQFGDYIGVGAGAHGKLTLDDGTIMRRWKRRSPADYQGGRMLAGQRQLDPGERSFEFMLNALRLNEGFSRAQFEQRTGLPLERLRQPLETAVAQGLLEAIAGGYRPTGRGRDMLDDLQALFL